MTKQNTAYPNTHAAVVSYDWVVRHMAAVVGLTAEFAKEFQGVCKGHNVSKCWSDKDASHNLA